MSESNLLKESKDILNFDSPKGQSSIIKVIGVGGGGNNAVNHMYKLGIIGVDFINCNTDLQVLEASPVPHIIRFGTLGTGAGSNPERGRQLAEESIEEIRSLLEKNTEMVFITAGMGGGTGTGAAPVIAAIARSMDILTVAIVTEPFAMEGKRRQEQARQGIKELKKYVDVLLVISNDRLREQYGDLKLTEAFQRADDVLANAAKGIAEIITVRGYMNVDLEDVKTVMRNSGTAIMGMGIAKGEDRAARVVEEALNSPLLNNIDIRGSKNLLLYITYGSDEVSMDEMGEITELVHERTGNNADLILGHGHDERLGEHIAVSIIATGFDTPKKEEEPSPSPNIFEYVRREQIEDKKVIPLNEEQVVDDDTSIHSDKNTIPEPVILNKGKDIINDTDDSILDMQLVVKKDGKIEIESQEKEEIGETPSFSQRHDPIFRKPVSQPNVPVISAVNHSQEPMKVIVVDDDDFEFQISEKPNFVANHQSNISPIAVRPLQETSIYPKPDSALVDDLAKNRSDKLRNFSIRSRTNEISGPVMEEPAFRRRNVQFEPADHSSESHASNYHLFPGEDGKLIFQQNHFLHDNVD